MAECFSQPSAVVRLRHHPQVSDLAEPQAQSHRGIRQLLRHARRLPSNASRRGAQRSHQDGSAGTAVQPQRGKLPFRTKDSTGNMKIPLSHIYSIVCANTYF